jgi:hypothetical protein
MGFDEMKMNEGIVQQMNAFNWDVGEQEEVGECAESVQVAQDTRNNETRLTHEEFVEDVPNGVEEVARTELVSDMNEEEQYWDIFSMELYIDSIFLFFFTHPDGKSHSRVIVMIGDAPIFLV